SPEEIYNTPSNSFVANFIGENNRLDGVIQSNDGEKCVVNVGGELVRSFAALDGYEGGKTTLSVRPEHIEINPPNCQGMNVFTAQVREKTFHGDHLRLTCALLGQDNFVAKINQSDVKTNIQ